MKFSVMVIEATQKFNPCLDFRTENRPAIVVTFLKNLRFAFCASHNKPFCISLQCVQTIVPE